MGNWATGTHAPIHRIVFHAQTFRLYSLEKVKDSENSQDIYQVVHLK